MTTGKGAAPAEGVVSDPDQILQAGADALVVAEGEFEDQVREALRAMLEAAGVTEYGSRDASVRDGERVLMRSITLRGQIALLDAAFPERETEGGQMMMDVDGD